MTDATAPELTHAQQVRNHWWWRPGWHHSRRFYTWHLTFEHQPQLHALVDAYQHQLADLPGLDLIPREWLHLTMQGIGFVDEVDDDQVDQLVHAAQRRLAALPAAEVTFHRPLLRPEAIVLPASPPEPGLAIRDAIRDAFTDTDLGDAPEERDGFLPHVSLAYVNQDGPAEPITAALAKVTAAPASVEISRASLIVLDRDTHMYHWRERADARTAQPTRPAPTEISS
jgi:2'-5' RNA ligase